MARVVVRALLIGDALGTKISSCAHQVNSIELDITLIDSLSDASHQLQQSNFDIFLVNLADHEADLIDTIRELNERASTTPILAFGRGDDLTLVARAVHAGAQDVIPVSALCRETLNRAILASVERKKLEQHRICNARKDELTGLANRLQLEERFSRAMARADRHATLVVLVAIDLDQPEELVRCYGYQTIDQLMPLIGERLKREIRETDTLARTRNAGFTWLVEDLSAINDVDALVGRLPDLLTSPFYLNGLEIFTTASVGVAISPFHGTDFKTLLDLAEAAMLDVATLNGDGLLMPPLPSSVEKSRAALTY